MKKNEYWQGTCTDYTYDGMGVVKMDDLVFFVPGLLRGETAKLKVTAMRKNYGYARVEELLTESKHRAKPACSVFKQCGGCCLMHMDEEEQETFKRDKVKGLFLQNADMDLPVNDVLCSSHTTAYRNKVQVPVQFDNKVKMGFYQNRSNTIVEFDYCMVQTKLSNRIVSSFKEWLEQYKCAKAFRHVLIKHAHRTGEVMICMVVREYPFHNSDLLIKKIRETYPEVKSVSAMVNRREDNVILDGKEVLLYGKPYIEEELLGCTFRISARSFFQINPYATEILYSKALEYAQLTGKETVIDLYCGTGTIGILASKKAKKVIGIEIVEDAIKDAKVNAKRNACDNIEFFAADAKNGAKKLADEKIHADVVIVDPPRKGCSKETLDAIERIAPERLVYVSCDPATLTRDCALLKEKGYNVEKVQPVDMFPNTNAVETVVSLCRKKKDYEKVRIELDLEALEATPSESKATYEEIKEYIRNNHDGMKVSTLYIAQVKQKYGIIERDCYNKAKSDNTKQPQCPPDKEEVIVDALKHFKMI